MINDSWLDRPLSVAGRVLVRREGGLEARLVDLKRDVALIPRVAIHLNRETNSGVKYDPARDLVALYAAGTGSGSFYREVARTADCAPEDVVAGDLVLYNNQPGTVWGAEGEFVSAPRLDDLAARDTWLNRLAPLPKLLAAVVYLAVTLSFGRYQLTGVLGMGLWPLLLLELADFTPGDALRAFKPVAVLLTVVGLCNLPFDRAVLLHAGPLSVTGGMLSLGVLLAKGLFCFLAVWVLIASTGMESVCAALQQLHCPRVLTTTILLIYRYIVLLLQEGIRIATAYALRAPGQKGIQFRAWGSLLGQLLLRSIDRAQLVYESMQLRGFAGAFPPGQKKHGGWLFLAVTVFYCAVFRAVPVFELAGRLL